MAITVADWSRRVEITDANVSPSLTGFTALLTQANLPAEIWSTALNGGGDLRVCLDSAGVNQLPLEVVEFDTIGETAVLWTRFDISSSASIWLFYGKAGETQPAVGAAFGRNAVWVDFEVVNHGRDYTNSTGKTGDLTVDGNAPTDSPIIFGGGLSFDGSSFLQTTIPTTITDPAVVTLQMWTRQRTVGVPEPSTFNNMAGVSLGSTAGGFDISTYPRESGSPAGWLAYVEPQQRITANTGTTYSGINVQGQPTYNALSLDYVAGDVRSYQKNSLIDTETLTAPNNNSTAYSLTRFAYGGRYDGSPDPYSGIVTEGRLKFSALSVDAARTEYNNQNSPSTFWSTGTPENTAAPGGVTANGAFALPILTASGTAAATLPQPSADGAFSFPLLTVASSGAATLPQPTATGAFSIPLSQYSGSVTNTLPQPTTNGSFTLPLLLVSGTGAATTTENIASGAITLPLLSVSGSASATLPQPSINGAFSLPSLTVSAEGSALVPQPIINGNITLPKLTISASGTVTLPQPVANGAFNIPIVNVKAFATVTGLDLIIDPKTNINQELLSANINQSFLSSSITYN